MKYTSSQHNQPLDVLFIYIHNYHLCTAQITTKHYTRHHVHTQHSILENISPIGHPPTKRQTHTPQGGNNENEDMLAWGEAVGRRDVYLVDYVKLYIDTIQPLVRCVCGLAV